MYYASVSITYSKGGCEMRGFVGGHVAHLGVVYTRSLIDSLEKWLVITNQILHIRWVLWLLFKKSVDGRLL